MRVELKTHQEWLKEALRKVLVRFGRMPRTGWSLAHAVYCGKFNVHTSLAEFKKKESNVLTSKSDRKCTNREFKKEAIKRVKTIDSI